jgi:serine/threonine protein kinase
VLAGDLDQMVFALCQAGILDSMVPNEAAQQRWRNFAGKFAADPHPEEAACHFLLAAPDRLLRSLAYLDFCHIAHFDLKLSNLMIDLHPRKTSSSKLAEAPDGFIPFNVVPVDFGTAKHIKGEEKVRNNVGTRRYRAPELDMPPHGDVRRCQGPLSCSARRSRSQSFWASRACREQRLRSVRGRRGVQPAPLLL